MLNACFSPSCSFPELPGPRAGMWIPVSHLATGFSQSRECPWGPLCLTRLAWAGPPAGREGGRRKVDGHLASAGLQNISSNRWEGLNVGALQNILLSLHQQMLICQYKRAGSSQVDVSSHLAFATRWLCAFGQ